MSDQEEKKNIIIQESALTTNEDDNDGGKNINGQEDMEDMDGGAKAKGAKAKGAEESEEEAKKEEEEEPKEAKEAKEAKRKKVKEKKSGNKKLGLDVGEQGEKGEKSSAAAAASDENEMSQLLNETIPWNIIDKLFSDNPNILVAHQLDSYNEFISNGISQIFKEHNPIVFQKEKNPQTDVYKHISRFYLGGKTGDKIYYGKPVIYDETGTTSRVHYMYPNEARLRNMTYGVTIHYDVDVEFEQEEQQQQQEASEAVSSSTKKFTKTVTLPQILLGKFPIMVHSNLCMLSGLPKDVIYNMGEDKSDHGGYFIIDGKEKLIVSQEMFADNMLYTRVRSDDDKYSHSIEIRTVSEDTSKPERKLRVYMVAPTPRYTNNQIVVEIPNVKKPIPLFILMRALGVISDYDIIETCLLNMAENRDLIEFFRPSVHDANKIFTQRAAIEYIGVFIKGKSVVQAQNILMNFFLPQIGELNFQSKAFFLGYMVNKLVRLKAKIDIPIDRDSFKYKRIKIPGKMLHSLFNEYYAQQIKRIRTLLDFKYNYNYAVYQENFTDIVKEYDDIFKDRIVEDGLRRAFKGNWGGSEFTKEAGIVQDLNRLSYNSAISHLRKVNLPLDDSAKVIKPRLLHGSQWCLMDPVDVPDSGLQKHFAISTHVTNGCKGSDMIRWLINEPGVNLLSLEKYPKDFLYYQTKVFVNGSWVGVVSEPEDVVHKIKTCRRLSMIPIYISCSWDIQMREINIFTDGGRPCRPAYYYDPAKKMFAFQSKSILNLLKNRKFSWNHIVGGFGIKKINHNSFFTTTDMTNIVKLYDELPENITFEKMMNRAAVVEYIDASEENNTLFAFRPDDKVKPGSAQFTHSDIHPSLMFGVMGNLISFPENNQLPRNVFSCSQSKQAVSMYNTSFLQRFDKMGVVLNNGQIPLVKTRYLKYFNDEQNPYGQNAMVAIMSYNGYNVEDSILFNEGSIKRGLFRTSYYNMYETREESKQSSGDRIDTRVLNMNDYQQKNAITNAGRGEGYDYSNLDSNGLIIENTPVSEKSVLIGQVVSESKNAEGKVVDASIRPKKGQIGYVDKTYITEGSNPDIPSRIAKVRIREDRAPNIGDKFASRCGQKGTVGLIIP